jgi:hypothetical protein
MGLDPPVMIQMQGGQENYQYGNEKWHG